MLTYPRQPISLSLTSTDLCFDSYLETAATLYQKTSDSFHLLLTEPTLPEDHLSYPRADRLEEPEVSPLQQPRLLWLEISPYRLILTMQSNGRSSYRHWFERGVYGMSRYWLQDAELAQGGQMRLRNYTRTLVLEGSPIPQRLEVEYELWANRVSLGSYQLNLCIHPDLSLPGA